MHTQYGYVEKYFYELREESKATELVLLVQESNKKYEYDGNISQMDTHT